VFILAAITIFQQEVTAASFSGGFRLLLKYISKRLAFIFSLSALSIAPLLPQFLNFRRNLTIRRDLRLYHLEDPL